MTKAEFEKFIGIYLNDWTLYARTSNAQSGGDISKYSYVYIDSMGINITFNLNTNSFKFGYNVGFTGFTLNSGEFSPIDHPMHFDKNYFKFKNVVSCIKHI